MTDASGSQDKKSHALTWMLCILAVPMIYVLSIGPAEYLYYTSILHPPVSTWLQTLYRPLVWFADTSPLSDLFHAYVNGWIKLAQRP